MFKDAQEALRRLEAELLADEEPELPEEFDEPDDLLEEPEALPPVYSNSSNRYRAYNADHTDTDLDRYSDQVREGRRSGRVLSLIAVILCLTAAVLALFAWWTVRQGG